jgi:nucleotide-binding universal stress UspA family protein
MYARVLLAYDGSDEGRKALREGALTALRVNAKVFLLCVAPESPSVRTAEGIHAGVIAQTQDIYPALFDEAIERLRDLGLSSAGKIVTGEPADEIASYAREVEADLVVVGHRRKSLIERWWSGDSGAYLVDRLQCTLLIARNNISDAEFYAGMKARQPAGVG